jgi:hypothetical protein
MVSPSTLGSISRSTRAQAELRTQGSAPMGAQITGTVLVSFSDFFSGFQIFEKMFKNIKSSYLKIFIKISNM